LTVVWALSSSSRRATVPVAAAIGVLVRFLLRQYLASPYYTGG